MFAIAGLLMRGREGPSVADDALKYADEFMAAREPQAEEEPEAGIAALKPKRGAKK
jgi:hypothetical protein